VIGLSVRTSNHDEMSPKTARIEKLWDKFFGDTIIAQIPNILDTERLYGVYSDYRFTGDTIHYTITAAVRVSTLDTIPKGLSGIHIPSQTYAVFDTATGRVEDILLETWRRIWKSSTDDLNGERAYLVDYEQFDGKDIADPLMSRARIMVGIRKDNSAE